MTGPDPFVPPAAPIRPSIPEPPTPSPPDLPTHRAPSAPPPVVPPPSRPRWVLPLVIAGGVVAFAVLAGAVVAAMLSIAPRILDTVVGESQAGDDGIVGEEDADWSDYPPADDLLQGDPGSPLAESPLDCAGCFTAVDAKNLQLDDALFAQLGLTEGIGTPQSARLARVQSETIGQWRAQGATPDACYFVWSYAPVPLTPDELDRDDPRFVETVVTKPDRVDATGYYSARTSVRVFGDSTGAVEHMSGLVDAIEGCPAMSWTTGETATLSAAPALDLPDDVAGYTWAEDNDGLWRFYGADLQRGNLVMRVTFNTDGYGPTETEFRSVVEDYARRLSESTPSG